MVEVNLFFFALASSKVGQIGVDDTNFGIVSYDVPYLNTLDYQDENI